MPDFESRLDRDTNNACEIGIIVTDLVGPTPLTSRPTPLSDIEIGSQRDYTPDIPGLCTALGGFSTAFRFSNLDRTQPSPSFARETACACSHLARLGPGRPSTPYLAHSRCRASLGVCQP